MKNAIQIKNVKYQLFFIIFIRGRKLNISLVFITQSYQMYHKILGTMNHFIMKIPNKQELQQIVFNYLSDIDFKDLMNL